MCKQIFYRNSSGQLRAWLVSLVLLLVSPHIILGQIVVDSKAHKAGSITVRKASNGVDVIDIVKPNQAGVSHNKFLDYNVAKRGVVLNNSLQKIARSKLGGFIVANPHLAGRQARLILNEITGSKRSDILGSTEVLGAKAAIVVANPNGIYIDGVRFINVSRATFTTGVPKLHAMSGNLASLYVDKGDIIIGGAGVDARDIDAFDLIGRAIKLRSTIHAQRLDLVAGRNEVNYTDRSIRQQLANLEQADVAIDSSALGGMYADKIRLISTESGVGVRLKGAVSASELFARAQGKVTLNRVKARKKVVVETSKGGIEVRQQIQSGGDVTIRAAEDISLADKANLLARNDISLQAKRHSYGKGSNVIAGIDATKQLTEGSNLRLLASEQITMAGRVLATGDSEVSADTMTVAAGAQFNIDKNAVITVARDFNNRGYVYAQGQLTMTSDKVLLEHTLYGKGSLQLRAGDVEVSSAGLLATQGKLMVNVSGSIDNAGSIYAGSEMLVQSDVSRVVGTLTTKGDLQLTSKKLAVAAGGKLLVAGNAKVVANNGVLTGRLEVGKQLDVTADNLEMMKNSSILSGHASNFTIAKRFKSDGKVHSGGNLQLRANEVIFANTANLDVRKSAAIAAKQWLNQATQMAVLGDMALTTTSKQATDLGKMVAGGLSIKAAGDVVMGQAQQLSRDLSITTTGNFINHANISAAAVQITAGQWHNQQRVTSRDNMSLTIDNLSNAQVLIAGKQLQITAQQFSNNSNAALVSHADSSVSAQQNIHNIGTILSRGKLAITSAGNVTNEGNLLAYQDISIAGLIATERANAVHNISGTIQSRQGNLAIRAKQLINRRKIFTIARESIDEGKYQESINRFDRYYLEDISGLHRARSYKGGGTLQGYRSNRTVYNYYRAKVANGTNIHSEERTTHRFRDQITANSAMAAIRSGKNMLLDIAGTIENSRSSIQASGDLQINANNLVNRADQVLQSDYISGYYVRYGLSEKKGTFKRSRYFRTWKYNEAFANRKEVQVLQQIASSIVAGGTISGNVKQQVQQSSAAVTINNGSFQLVDPEKAGGNAATKPFAISKIEAPTNRLEQVTTDPLAAIGSLNTLFSPQNARAQFLVETRPEFVDPNLFLGSDYFFSRNGNTENKVKRLGDSYFDALYIAEQMRRLTGKQHYYTTPAGGEKMQRLMDQSLQAQQDLQLRVGVALTAEQFNRLQHDIVWYVEREVQGEQVLVPQVYLAANTVANLKRNNVMATGGSIEAKDIKLQVAGDIINQGNLTADTIDITANNIENRLGTMLANIDLSLRADGNINNQSANLSAGNNLQLVAGNNITNSRIKQQLTGYLSSAGESSVATEQVLLQSGLIQAGKRLTMVAGNVINNLASKVTAQSADIRADKDINILAVATQSSHRGKYHNGYSNSDKTTQHAAKFDVDSILVLAGNNINITGSHIKAKGAVTLAANNDIKLQHSSDQQTLVNEFKARSSSLFGSSSSLYKSNLQQSFANKSSIVSDGDVKLQAGRDIKAIATDITSNTGALLLRAGNSVGLSAAVENKQLALLDNSHSSSLIGRATENKYKITNEEGLAATNIQSKRALTIQAGNDINATAALLATDGLLNAQAGNNIVIGTQAKSRSSHETMYIKKIGFNSTVTDTSVGSSFGVEKTQSSKSSNRSQQVASIITGKQVSLLAGKDLTLVKAQLSADRALQLVGDSVTITGAEDIASSQSDYRSKKFARESSAAITGVLVDLYHAAKQIDSGSSRRVRRTNNAAAAAKFGSSLFKVLQKGKQSLSSDNIKKLVRIKLFGGLVKSEEQRRTSSYSSIYHGSRLQSAGDITIAARATDINVKGSQLQAQQALILQAKRDVNLLAGQSIERQHSYNKSNSAKVGAFVNLQIDADGNYDDSAGIELGFNKSKQQWQRYAKRHVNSQLASNRLTMVAGRDTTLRGAQARANQITATTGRDFKISSLLDVVDENYRSDSSAMGLSIGLSATKVVSTKTTYANFNNTKQRGSLYSATIGQQSGLVAGKGGYHLTVDGKLALLAGVIHADKDAKNSLSAAEITTQSLEEKRHYQTSSQSQGFNISLNTSTTEAMQRIGANLGGRQREGDSEQRTRRSAITGYNATSDETAALLEQQGLRNTVNIRKELAEQTEYNRALTTALANTAELTGDVAGYLEKKSNDKKKKILEQYVADKAAGKTKQTLMQYLADRADTIAEQNKNKKASIWREGGTGRSLLHALTAAAVVGISGDGQAITQAAGGALAGSYSTRLSQAILGDEKSEVVRSIVGNLVATAAGQVVGGDTGSHVANQYNLNNRQLHESEEEEIRRLAPLFAKHWGKGWLKLNLSNRKSLALLRAAAETLVDRFNYSKNFALIDNKDLQKARNFLLVNRRNKKLFYANSKEYSNNIDENSYAEKIDKLVFDRQKRKMSKLEFVNSLLILTTKFNRVNKAGSTAKALQLLGSQGKSVAYSEAIIDGNKNVRETYQNLESAINILTAKHAGRYSDFIERYSNTASMYLGYGTRNVKGQSNPINDLLTTIRKDSKIINGAAYQLTRRVLNGNIRESELSLEQKQLLAYGRWQKDNVQQTLISAASRNDNINSHVGQLNKLYYGAKITEIGGDVVVGAATLGGGTILKTAITQLGKKGIAAILKKSSKTLAKNAASLVSKQNIKGLAVGAVTGYAADEALRLVTGKVLDYYGITDKTTYQDAISKASNLPAMLRGTFIGSLYSRLKQKAVKPTQNQLIEMNPPRAGPRSKQVLSNDNTTDSRGEALRLATSKVLDYYGITDKTTYQDAISKASNLPAMLRGTFIGSLYSRLKQKAVKPAQNLLIEMNPPRAGPRSKQVLSNDNTTDSRGISFHFTRDGTRYPAVAYRALSHKASIEAMKSGNIMSENLTYITFDDISNMSGAQIKDLLQLSYTPTHFAKFDIFPVIDSMIVPKENWHRGTKPEPRAIFYKIFGKGGGSQMIVEKKIKNYILKEVKKDDR